MSLMKNTFRDNLFDKVTHSQAHYHHDVIANNWLRKLEDDISENAESPWKKRII
ncbi:unnamed protein product [Moneuplotes crassus]|uniref:Uncharacterized protein n=1 Tax=Euplotes crassus TaxID=5936 RepID=A0AAD1X9R2_EUPCR|nr:unnamed protein product [Moneuplotes crassus]